MDPLNVFDIAPADLARPALIADSRVWSWLDVSHGAAATLRHLEARGVGGGARVALTASPTPAVFLAIHAISALGATLVPIHPRLSPAEARVVLDVARVDLALSPEDLALASSNASPALASSNASPALASSNASPALASRPARSPSSPATAPFAIVSTSGTTGRPRAAVLSRRAFLASAAASAKNLGWEPDDRWLACMPLAHVGGLSILTRCLVARRPVVLLPRFDPPQLLDAIERHHVTLVSIVPTMLHALLEADTRNILSRPRALLVGGAAAPPALLDECARRRVRAFTTYGLTEACSQVTTQTPRDPSIRLEGSGAPLDGFDLRIAAEDGAALPAHRTGRILVRGPALFDGYLRDDGSHSIDPARTSDGFFDTGDLGELDDRRQLHVHARRTDLIVTGGENVYPAEVEQALERSPLVRRALVFGVPDDRWGQVVAAAIEVESTAIEVESTAIDPAHRLSSTAVTALVDLLSSSLAPHKRPRKIAIVHQLSLTPSGKVDRKDALARYGDTVSPLT